MRAALLALSLLVIAPAALAHHGWSGYDEKNLQTYSGSIVESAWANPHATITLETKTGTWKVILAPVSRMQSRGMNEGMIAKGATVTVAGYAHKEHKGEMRAERITVGDKTFELR